MLRGRDGKDRTLRKGAKSAAPNCQRHIHSQHHGWIVVVLTPGGVNPAPTKEGGRGGEEFGVRV